MYQQCHYSEVKKIFHGFSLDPWMNHLDYSSIAYFDYFYCSVGPPFWKWEAYRSIVGLSSWMDFPVASSLAFVLINTFITIKHDYNMSSETIFGNSARLVHPLKHMFSIFKLHYTYFYTLFHQHVFPHIFSVFKCIYQTPPQISFYSFFFFFFF